MDVHGERFDELCSRVLYGEGDAPSELRRSAAETAARAVSGRDSPEAAAAATPPSGDLVEYIETVARHAYKTVDADIDQLRAASLSEDAIFELSVSAALGVAREQVERAAALIEGDR